MVSVIIPVYNVISYIDRCMESVVNQSYHDIEIILINDGSTDGSDSKCMEWAKRDSRIIYISKKNEGLGTTRNFGIKIAKAEYITFLDSDDWLDIMYIEKMYGAVMDTQADIGICDINYVNSFSNEVSVSQIRFCGRLSSAKEDIMVMNKIRTFAWGKIYKKTLFERYNISYPQIAFEDIPCTPILAILAEKITYVPEALCYYFRGRNESLSNDLNSISDMIKALSLLCERFEQFKLNEKYDSELKKMIFSQVRFCYIKCQECKENLPIVQKKIESLLEFMQDRYPELENFENKTFLVMGDAKLIEAVKKVVYKYSQIVTKFTQNIDYVIKYSDDIKFGLVGIKEIHVIRTENQEEIETIYWDIAEQIMAKL
ncbi:MAG: glycosyltransferase family 2 protein [Ruminiclostridium sp.]